MLDTCIIFNGPPGCGKDTLAELLADEGYKHMAMKTSLYKATATYFNVDLEAFIDQATDRVCKELPWHPLRRANGNARPNDVGNLIHSYTPREALIHVSEDIIKPTYGEDFFGKAAAQSCLNADAQYAVFSDGGFKEEIYPLMDVYQTVFIIQLFRKGCSFANDSRDYLNGFPNTHTLFLEEDQPELAIQSILSIVENKDVTAA